MNTVLSIEEKFFDSSIKKYLIATHSITKKYIKAKIRSSKGKIKTTCYDKKHLQKVVYLLTILNNFTFIYWFILLHYLLMILIDSILKTYEKYYP